MFRKCCVFKCPSDGQYVKLHRFPISQEHKNNWLQHLNIKDLDEDDLKNVHVCHKHFEKRFVKSSNRLTSDAYPSLFTDMDISTGIPSVSYSDTDSAMLAARRDQVNHDHTYSMVNEPIIAAQKQALDIDQNIVEHITSPETCEANTPMQNEFDISVMPSTSHQKCMSSDSFSSSIEISEETCIISNNIYQDVYVSKSNSTLKKITNQLKVEAGINPHIFNLMKKQIHNWYYLKKLCTVMFGEMVLETAAPYTDEDDYSDMNDKPKQRTYYVLTFILRGAVYKWQQPIAFYLFEEKTSKIQLKEIIKSVISAVTEAGLDPIALVCDQKNTFQSTLKDLLEETKKDEMLAGENFNNTINLNGNSLSVFYNTPHLMKGMRNNFVTKDIYFDGKRAKWQDIVDIYNIDSKVSYGTRILPKLTDEHVIPGKIKKNEVKYCVCVLSKSVSAALSYTANFACYPDGKPVSSTLLNTAIVVSFLDDLFDSCNGFGRVDKKSTFKPLRKAVTTFSTHHAFWREALKKLEHLKFITNEEKFKCVPSINNWIVTINSFQRVWRFLKSKNMKIMNPVYFNADPVENFFTQVRACYWESNDPTTDTFINTFKSVINTGFIIFNLENVNRN